MTATERLVAASRGGEVDRKPVIYWPGAADIRSDAVITAPDPSFVERHLKHESRAVLVEVPNPYGKAWARGVDLNRLLGSDPAEGARVLDGLVESVRKAMHQCLEAGADGIVYRLHGANASHCSPMQYGGHYLERDRELLEEVRDARFNLCFVVGDRDLYLDFVSDLPAHVLGWDDQSTGIGTIEGRALRGGAVATYDQEADVILVHPPTTVSVSQVLEKPRT